MAEAAAAAVGETEVAAGEKVREKAGGGIGEEIQKCHIPISKTKCDFLAPWKRFIEMLCSEKHSYVLVRSLVVRTQITRNSLSNAHNFFLKRWIKHDWTFLREFFFVALYMIDFIVMIIFLVI